MSSFDKYNTTMLEEIEILPKSMKIILDSFLLNKKLVKIISNNTPSKVGIKADLLYMGPSKDVEGQFTFKVIQRRAN